MIVSRGCHTHTPCRLRCDHGENLSQHHLIHGKSTVQGNLQLKRLKKVIVKWLKMALGHKCLGKDSEGQYLINFEDGCSSTYSIDPLDAYMEIL